MKSPVRKKGYMKEENPEKMPPITAGIVLSRGDAASAGLKEQLTGGNQPADETDVAALVTRFISQTK